MKNKAVFIAAAVLLAAVMLFSAWKVYSISSDYRESEKSYEALRSLAFSEPSAAPKPAAKMPQPSASPAPTEIPYPEECPKIDFAALSEVSDDIIGWIYSEGTVINYPILQTDDNGTYLHAAPDGSYLYAGSIYADCRSVPPFTCENTIIYGHRMADGSMFASLRDYRDESYYPDHPVIWIITPDRPYRADVIAGAVVEAEDAIYYDIDNADAVSENVKRIIEKSTFKSSCTWDGKAPLITLSTCTYEFDNARYVLLCALN